MGKIHFLPSGDMGFSAHFSYCTFFYIFFNEKKFKLSVR